MSLFHNLTADQALPDFLGSSRSIVIALVELDGNLLECNQGFLRIAQVENAPASTWNVAHLFIQPRFDHLLEKLGLQPSEALSSNLINLGIEGAVPVTLRGQVLRHPRGLLLIAEHEVEELTKLRDSVLMLNEELADTQRHLVRDVQARRRAERALEETTRGILALYAELEEKAHALKFTSERKSQFLSNLAHELRSPLAAIITLSQLLLDQVDGSLSSEQVTQARFIHKSAETLAELINDLPDLAKIEAGKLTIRPTTFAITELFSTLRGMLRPLATSAATTLAFSDTLGLPSMTSDQGKLAQILRNLIANAIKFTPRGEVRVSARVQNSDMIFDVVDTGIGIPTPELERIFEMFAQVESPAQLGIRGTGVGLPLSRQLAELLGGSLTVQSNPGVGSTFRVRLPQVYSEPAQIAPEPSTTK